MSRWLFENGEWFLPLIVGASVFLATLAILWPKRPESISSWVIPDDSTFDEALTSGGPLPWIWGQ